MRGLPHSYKAAFGGNVSAMKLNSALGGKYAVLSILGAILGLFPLTVAAQPDLVINVQRAKSSVQVNKRIFAAGDCAVQEGCVRAVGGRKLLRLDVGVANVGASDLRIGDPNRRPDLFVWSSCHGHYHLKGLAMYRVLNLRGYQVAKTYKQGFCLRDDHPALAGAGPAKYTCDYQGITTKWQDIYDKSLDCQWVDITYLAPGPYNLEITVNPASKFAESNYRNNRVIFRIYVPKNVYYY